jgi:hypothetical protein
VPYIQLSDTIDKKRIPRLSISHNSFPLLNFNDVNFLYNTKSGIETLCH